MGKSLADAMNAQPGPDSLAYWLAPFKGYFDRQGKMAQGGLDQAEQGAQSFRDNLSPMGLANMLMGPANYLASPITALLPTEAEAYAARDLPEWSKPGMAGILGTAMAVMPGPKFKGLGAGMEKLAEGATDAERAALAARLESEAAQAGGVASMATRDEALANLVGAQPKPRKGITTQSYKVTYEDGTTGWEPGTLRVNPPRGERFNSELTPADIEKLGFVPAPRKKGEIVTQSYKETDEDGVTRWVPGTLRAKRPPKK